VLAIHGRQESNLAAPATLLPDSTYSDQEVEATAAKVCKVVAKALGYTSCSACCHHGQGVAGNAGIFSIAALGFECLLAICWLQVTQVATHSASLEPAMTHRGGA
jgi:hypothetical protein